MKTKKNYTPLILIGLVFLGINGLLGWVIILPIAILTLWQLGVIILIPLTEILESQDPAKTFIILFTKMTIFLLILPWLISPIILFFAIAGIEDYDGKLVIDTSRLAWAFLISLPFGAFFYLKGWAIFPLAFLFD